MVFTRRVRSPNGSGFSGAQRVFPTFRRYPTPQDFEDVEKEKENIKSLIEFELVLDELRQVVEDYYAGQSTLEAVLQEMMDTGLCHALNPFK